MDSERLQHNSCAVLLLFQHQPTDNAVNKLATGTEESQKLIRKSSESLYKIMIKRKRKLRWGEREIVFFGFLRQHLLIPSDTLGSLPSQQPNWLFQEREHTTEAFSAVTATALMVTQSRANSCSQISQRQSTDGFPTLKVPHKAKITVFDQRKSNPTGTTAETHTQYRIQPFLSNLQPQEPQQVADHTLGEDSRVGEGRVYPRALRSSGELPGSWLLVPRLVAQDTPSSAPDLLQGRE